VIRFIQRFIVSKLLIINSTFNTNKLRLLLLISVSIINNNKTFLYVSSYCLSETAESYNFFFQTLRQEI
jgi:hypothetical protein